MFDNLVHYIIDSWTRIHVSWRSVPWMNQFQFVKCSAKLREYVVHVWISVAYVCEECMLIGSKESRLSLLYEDLRIMSSSNINDDSNNSMLQQADEWITRREIRINWKLDYYFTSTSLPFAITFSVNSPSFYHPVVCNMYVCVNEITRRFWEVSTRGSVRYVQDVADDSRLQKR